MAAFGGLTPEQAGLGGQPLGPSRKLGADGKIYLNSGELWNPDPTGGQPIMPRSSFQGNTSNPNQAYSDYLGSIQQYQQQQMQQMQQQMAQQPKPAPVAAPAAPPAQFDPQSLSRFVTNVPMNVLNGGNPAPARPSYAAHPFGGAGQGGAFAGLNTGAPALTAQPAAAPEHLADGGPPAMSAAPWYMRREATAPHFGGFLPGASGGRTDNKNISVPGGSFVIPADVVSGLGQGNSMAGANVLHKMFSTGPYGMKLNKMNRASSGLPRAPGMTKFAAGGVPPGHTPIVAAAGEFVVPPDAISNKFGDLDKGHKVLNKFVVEQRKNHVKTLKKLPPPK